MKCDQLWFKCGYISVQAPQSTFVCYTLHIHIQLQYVRLLSTQTGNKAEGQLSQVSVVVDHHNIPWSVYLMFYEQDFLRTFVALTRQLVWLHEINDLDFRLGQDTTVSESIKTQKHNKTKPQHCRCSTAVWLH